MALVSGSSFIFSNSDAVHLLGVAAGVGGRAFLKRLLCGVDVACGFAKRLKMESPVPLGCALSASSSTALRFRLFADEVLWTCDRGCGGGVATRSWHVFLFFEPPSSLCGLEMVLNDLMPACLLVVSAVADACLRFRVPAMITSKDGRYGMVCK